MIDIYTRIKWLEWKEKEVEADPTTGDSGKGCCADKTNVRYMGQGSDLKHLGV